VFVMQTSREPPVPAGHTSLNTGACYCRAWVAPIALKVGDRIFSPK